MFIAENWRDYELLDCSSGEKLERWGSYVLRRPDPQVIWKTPQESALWKKLNGHYHRSQRGGGEWEFFDLPKQWSISYVLGGAGRREGELSLPSVDYGCERVEYSCLSELPPEKRTLCFHLKPFAFKHTGLFPEQAANWDWFSDKILSEQKRRRAAGEERPVRVLNLFAYTGGATLAAAKSGAEVTHVDAAKGMVQWAKENAQSSGLGGGSIRWLVDDCGKFVDRELRRGKRYDAIIMDPPSYGRGPGGEVWKLEDAIYDLIERASRLLDEASLFFLLNSYTTGLQPAVMSYMLSTLLKPRLGGDVRAEELGLPVTKNRLALPCGCSARWERRNSPSGKISEK